MFHVKVLVTCIVKEEKEPWPWRKLRGNTTKCNKPRMYNKSSKTLYYNDNPRYSKFTVLKHYIFAFPFLFLFFFWSGPKLNVEHDVLLEIENNIASNDTYENLVKNVKNVIEDLKKSPGLSSYAFFLWSKWLFRCALLICLLIIFFNSRPSFSC